MINADSARGAVIFGISSTGEVIGVEPGNPDKAQRSLVQYIGANFAPSIQCEIEITDDAGKKTLKVSAERKENVAYHEFKGRAFIREGTSTRQLKLEEKHSLFAHRDRDNSRPYARRGVRFSPVRVAVLLTLLGVLALAVVVWLYEPSRTASHNNPPQPQPTPPTQAQLSRKAAPPSTKQHATNPYRSVTPSTEPKREYGPEQLPPGGNLTLSATEQRQDELKSIPQEKFAQMVIEANSRMRKNAREWDVPGRMGPDINADEQDPQVRKQWQDETKRIMQENWDRPKQFRYQFEKKFADERLILDEMRARLLPPHPAAVDIYALPTCNVFFDKGDYTNRNVWECVDELDEIVRDYLDK